MDKPYTVEEVRYALFQMHPSKSPWVDGYTAGFFRGIGASAWDVGPSNFGFSQWW
jgi:hypothetical protein